MEPGHIIKFLSFCWWNKNVPVLLTMLVLCAGPPISVPELLTVSTCDFFSEACPWPPGASSAQPYEEREENLCSPKLVLGQCLKYWDREGQTVCSLVGTNLRGNSRSRAPEGSGWRCPPWDFHEIAPLASSPFSLVFPTSLETPPLKNTPSASGEPGTSNGKGEGEGARGTPSGQARSFARSESYREVRPAWPVSCPSE